MMERKPRTHILRIDVPLNLDANSAAESWGSQGAFQEAVSVVLSVTRLGTLGLLCDGPTVELLAAEQEPKPVEKEAAE